MSESPKFIYFKTTIQQEAIITITIGEISVFKNIVTVMGVLLKQ